VNLNFMVVSRVGPPVLGGLCKNQFQANSGLIR